MSSRTRWFLHPGKGALASLAGSFVLVLAVSLGTLSTTWVHEDMRYRQWATSPAPWICRGIESACQTEVSEKFSAPDDSVRAIVGGSLYALRLDQEACDKKTPDPEAAVVCRTETRRAESIFRVFIDCKEKGERRLGVSCGIRQPGTYRQMLTDELRREAGSLAAWSASLALFIYLAVVSLVLLAKIPHAGWRRVISTTSVVATLATCAGVVLHEGANGYLLALLLLLPVLVCINFTLLGIRALAGWIRNGFDLERGVGPPSSAPLVSRPPVSCPGRPTHSRTPIAGTSLRRVMYWLGGVIVFLIVAAAVTLRPDASREAAARALGHVLAAMILGLLLLGIRRVMARLRKRSADRRQRAIWELRAQRDADHSPMDSSKIMEFAVRYRSMTPDELTDLYARRDLLTREALEALYIVLGERGLSREMLTRFE